MDPINDVTTWIPVAVLTASILGSAHCVAMCGGLIVASAKSKQDLVNLHLGRLFGYLTLGSFAGLLGSVVFRESAFSPIAQGLSWAVAATLAFLFILSGVRLWQGRSMHVQWFPKRVQLFLFRLGQGNARFGSFITGLATAALPCGWLHSFVLGAVATQSPVKGAGFLFAFWIGTLPALGLAPWMVGKILSPFAQRFPKFAAILLISAGLMSLSGRAKPFSVAPQKNSETDTKEMVHHCH